jgi:hypothetical protein
MTRITTSCDVFADKGDPWLTERERAEMRAQLAPVRGGRRLATAKTPFRDPVFRKPKRSEQSVLGEQSLRLQQAIIAGLGGSRSVVGKPDLTWCPLVQRFIPREAPRQV